MCDCNAKMYLLLLLAKQNKPKTQWLIPLRCVACDVKLSFLVSNKEYKDLVANYRSGQVCYVSFPKEVS